VELVPSGIPGCAELVVPRHPDDRGFLAKLFMGSALRAAGAEVRVDEVFVSESRRDVIRGLHFQVPPHAVVKLVYCLTGAIRDVVVDLRTDSPTYGEHRVFELTAAESRGVLVPVGCAHGFGTVSDVALVAYLQQGEFDPECDGGIHWSSVAVDWGAADPVVSARDQALPHLADFDSPFRIDADGEH
jgi:dTDP-4-dehydrorhamnose 3,5-epimerase